MKRLVVVFLFLVATIVTKPAKSEQTDGLSTQFTSIFEMLEKLVLTDSGIPGFGIPGTLAMGGCTASVKPVIPTVVISFAQSSTCPIAGNITLGIFPMRASVHLDVYQIQFIERIDFDLTATLRRRNKTTYVNWMLVNGQISVRLNPSGPLTSWHFSGAGQREKNKQSLKAVSRINVFEKESTAGFTILRNITQTKPNPKEKQIIRCQLTDGIANDVNSGTLANCMTNGSPIVSSTP